MRSPINTLNDALFLNVDGTLLDTAPAPGCVLVPQHLPELLHQLWCALNGALALISGRQLEDLDRLFSPYRFAAVGAHGCERRTCDGALHAPDMDRDVIYMLHDACCSFVGDSPGVLVDYKPYGVAVHYQLAPQLERFVRQYLEGLVRRAGHDFAIESGKYFCEIKPAAYSKQLGLLELMQSPEFQGRRPIYIADDITDENGFDTVNRLGGISVRVDAAAPTVAQYRFNSTADVHLVLELMAAAIRRSSARWH